MTFQWQTTPEDAFQAMMDDYQARLMDGLFEICEQFAVRIQAWMRANAPWHDSCMPSREYLVTAAYRDDAALTVGVTAYYDLDVYRAQCPEPEWDWGWAHETFTFAKAGVISIILPRGAQGGVLGDLADDLWDAVRAKFQ